MKSENNFINGAPELLILQFLEGKEMYGYQLVASIREKSREAFTFGEGCIYPLLHSLEKKGFIQKSVRIVEGRQRYYYRVTSCGQKRLGALTQDWVRVQEGMNLVLGGHHAIA